MFSVEIKLSRHAWGPEQCHQMTNGGGGSKIAQKVSRII